MAKRLQGVPPKVENRRVPYPSEGSLFASGLIILFGLVFYWLFRLPSSGIAVALLASVAGAMSLDGGPKGRRKFFWLILLGFLTSLEIRAIQKDRSDQDDHFFKILDTITGGDSY